MAMVGLLLVSFGCGKKEEIPTDAAGKRVMTDAEKQAIQAESEKYGF